MQPMKKIYLALTLFGFIALFYFPSSFAAGPIPIELGGTNQSGEQIYLMNYGDSESIDQNDWLVKVRHKDQEHDIENQKQSCSLSRINEGVPLSGREIHCNKNGASILSGVTYKFVKDLKKCRGFLFICTSGCGPRAPKEMIQNAGCDYD